MLQMPGALQMLVRTLHWLGETLSSRKKLIINDECGGGPYLTRYYIIGHRTSRWALMLHHFHRSDMDRDLHDHPWAFWSLILSGGYWEITPDNWCRWYKSGRLLKRPAKWVHRVRLMPCLRPTWTLVLRFSYERRWGFHTKDGWVAYDRYDYKAGCE